MIDRAYRCIFVILFLPSLAAAQTVAGRALDPQDRPVAGARVIVLDDTRVVAVTTTTADGRFGPLAVAADTVDVVVSSPGLEGRAARVALAAPPATSDVLVRLALVPVTESVVVSATQVETTRSLAPATVTVVDRATIDARQIETVADALRLVPGFLVVATGGRGALTSVFPRGGESDYTAFLADGIPLNAFGGSFDAAHFSTVGVDRVEVVGGPLSARFGGGAIGGVVQLITRAAGPFDADGAVEIGSQATSRLTVAAAGARRGWSWGAGIDRLRSEGDTRVFPSIGGPVANDDDARVSGYGHAAWSGAPDRRVRVDVRAGRDERGYPGPYGSDPDGLYGGLDRISRGINRPVAVAASARLRTGAVRHHGQVTWLSAPAEFVSPFGESEARTRRQTARYQLDVASGRWDWSTGVEALSEREDNTFITGEVFQPVPVRRSIAGVFAEARRPLGGRGALLAGVRIERIQRTALEADPNPFGPRPPFADDTVVSANPRAGLTWAIGGRTTLRASAGTGIKPPTAFEIAYTDNPSLRPERSRSLDLGVEHALARGLRVSATYFANRFDDLIVAVGSSLSGASRYRTDNIANARAAGLEIGASWVGPGGVGADLAWTILDTSVLAVDGTAGRAPSPYDVGDPLLRRARGQGTVGLRWAGAAGSAFFTLGGRTGVRDLEPNWAASVYDTPGFAVASAGGTWRLSRRLGIVGRVTNLFDRRYEDVLGFPAPGRLGMVGVRVAVGG
jgi:outer membrane cobalamin receptor